MTTIRKGQVDWLQEILNYERKYHFDFFGEDYDLSEFEKTLKKYGKKKINKWKKFGLEPHFPPGVVMTEDVNYPGWKTKPEACYYKLAAEGKILRNVNGKLVVDRQPFKLGNTTVLIDVRLKPHCECGSQVYENDNLLGPVIKQLREDEMITEHKYGPQSSRFGVSVDKNKWNQIRLLLSERIGLNQIRQERIIEANIIPQLYPYMPRKDDGNTNTFVWCEEFFEDDNYRFVFGCSTYGGLACVSYRGSCDNPPYVSFRPLIVL